MNKHFSIKVALGALALVALAGTASAIHSWGPYHWARTANPFTLKVVDSVTSTWDSYLDTSNTDWTVSSVLDLTKEAGLTGNSERRRCYPVAGKIRACNYTYGNNGWLGVAQIWITTGSHIAQGAVKLNDTYFGTTKYNTPAWRNLVMCQEIGHTFGLDHQDENFGNTPLGTCMDYSSDPVPNQHPNAHDYEQLELIYAHLDSFTTISSLIGKAGANRAKADEIRARADEFRASAEEIEELGKSLKRDSHGRTSLFERDLGRGEKVFTFVFWAE